MNPCSPSSRLHIGVGLVVVLLATACGAPRTASSDQGSEAPTPSLNDSSFATPTAWWPARDWRKEPRAVFESHILTQQSLPSSELSTEARQELGTALRDDPDAEIQMRAALLLAASRTDTADALLLGALEARDEIPSRHADAALVVAAARLGASSLPGIDEALLSLATGASPHPDLEIQTECARAALAHGKREATLPLLAIARLGTPLGIERDGSWHTPELTTWSRTRAAETLAEFAGIPCPYRGDASIAAREQACLALEAALP
mgnify:CR=1 FL=1